MHKGQKGKLEKGRAGKGKSQGNQEAGGEEKEMRKRRLLSPLRALGTQ